MNVFLPANNDRAATNQPIIIDFASAGVGFGMSDVAMHIWHAVLPEDLASGGEERLVRAYIAALEEAVASSSAGGAEQPENIYPAAVAMRHYRLASIDYMRFILGRFWKSASREGFDKRKDSENTTIINRNVKAALACVERVGAYLTEIEKEEKEKA